MGRVRILCGPRLSDRVQRTDAIIHDNWGRAFLILPNRLCVRPRLERLILDHSSPGIWGRMVMTFEDLVTEILAKEGINANPIDEIGRAILLRQAIALSASAGSFDSIGAVAGTAGFSRHIERVITQLKQAAVEPAQFADAIARRSRPSSLDPVVAHVYAAYQGALQDAGAYDRVGLFWEARVVCEKKTPALFARVRALVFDGFDDFTPSEFRLLRHLAGHLDELAFGIAADAETPARADLYTLPLDTLREIRQQFPEAALVNCANTTPETMTEHTAASLFGRDFSPPPEDLRPNLRLVPCLTPAHEIEVLGREIKSLILDGKIAPGKIAVVFHGIERPANLLRSVFDEFGIPAEFAHGRPLTESAIACFVLAVYEALADWDREAVLDVLASPWFRPEERPSQVIIEALPALSRMAQVVAGSEEWKDRCNRLAQRLEAALASPGSDARAEAFLEAVPHAREGASALQSLLDVLARIDASLPERGALGSHAEAIEGLLDSCGISHVLDEQDTLIAASIIRIEREAFASLCDLLGRLRAGCARFGGGQVMDRTEFVAFLRDVLRNTSFAESPPGGVACLDASQVRHVEFDYVFFAGVNEGNVPSPPVISAVYGDADVEDLAQLGIRLDDRRKHILREERLFQHVFSAARKQLWVSWHTLAQDGKPSKPSPFADDVLALFPGADSGILAPPPGPDSFVPAVQQVACWRDVRNTVSLSAIDAVEAAFPEHFAPIQRKAAVEQRRHRQRPFDEYDGVLSDASIIGPIAARFAPSHEFSAGQMTQFFTCPFAFFVAQILGIEEPEVPDEQFDPRVRGIILHEVLHAFHHAYRGQALSEIPEDQALDTLARLVKAVFASHTGQALTVPQSVVGIEQIRMEAVLRRYVRIGRAADDAAWKPMYFEVSFGSVRHPSQTKPSLSAPFPLETPDGPVLFAGRIDRIDVNGDLVRILDYKTTLYKKDDVAEFQPSLYALAAQEHLLRDCRCEEAWLAQPGRAHNGWHECLGRNSRRRDWDEREPALREKVASAVAAVRAGRFPPVPGKECCSLCAVRRACRYEPGRIRMKQGAETSR